MGVVNGYLTRIEELGPIAQKVGTKADQYACKIISLLEDIRDAVSTGYDVDVFESPSYTFTGATEVKTSEARAGYVRIIKRIAIIAGGAADVDIYVGSVDNAGFRKRVSFSAAGRNDQDTTIPVMEGQPVYITSSAAGVTVNPTIQRIML